MNMHRMAHFIGSVSDRRSSIAAFALTTAAAFGSVDVGVNALCDRMGICGEWQRRLQTASIAAAAGTVAVLVLSARGERRKHIRSEIERAIELNHKMRNHLQLLCDANYLGEFPERKAVVQTTIESMSGTLQTLLASVSVNSSGRD